MAKSKKFRNGLTLKQDKLVKVVAKQIKETGTVNLMEAGMEVYDSNSPKAASVTASQTLDIPAVKARLEKALEDKGMSLEELAGNISFFANFEHKVVTPEQTLKANLSLLKLLVDKKKETGPVKNTFFQFNYTEAVDKLKSIAQTSTTLVDDAEIE